MWIYGLASAAAAAYSVAYSVWCFKNKRPVPGIFVGILTLISLTAAAAVIMIAA